MPAVQARGHQEFARALRRRLVQERRLDIDKALLVEKTPRRHRCAVPQPQVALHRLASQVEHAVLEPPAPRKGLVAELERRRRPRIHNPHPPDPPSPPPPPPPPLP